MNELVIELERKAAGMTDETPYCVLSRSMVHRVIDALGRPPVEDLWLMEVQRRLTPTEFRIYQALYRARGKAVENALLLRGARIAQLETLWVHVRRLRMKAEMYGLGEIKTVRECGYFLEMPEGGWR